jgi:hypothetical protein
LHALWCMHAGRSAASTGRTFRARHAERDWTRATLAGARALRALLGPHRRRGWECLLAAPGQPGRGPRHDARGTDPSAGRRGRAAAYRGAGRDARGRQENDRPPARRVARASLHRDGRAHSRGRRPPPRSALRAAWGALLSPDRARVPGTNPGRWNRCRGRGRRRHRERTADVGPAAARNNGGLAEGAPRGPLGPGGGTGRSPSHGGQPGRAGRAEGDAGRTEPLRAGARHRGHHRRTTARVAHAVEAAIR